MIGALFEEKPRLAASSWHFRAALKLRRESDFSCEILEEKFVIVY